MKKFILVWFWLNLTDLLWALKVPLRLLVEISTLRENQLVGYGLVVGLSRTGDSRSPLATDALRKVLSYRGIDLPEKGFESRNIAAVMVMAKIPPLAKKGDGIDIWVSSIGDAKSIEGGYLLQTPLSAPDGTIYAVAQGNLTTTKQIETEASEASLYPFVNRVRRQKPQNEKTNTIFVPRGAILERELTEDFFLKDGSGNHIVKLRFVSFDPVTAHNALKAINEKYPTKAQLEEATLLLSIPPEKTVLEFLAEILSLPVEAANPKKVVIDSRTGTVAMGGAVAIGKVAITHGSLSIQSKEKAAYVLEEAPTVGELVQGLNQMGISPSEIAQILKAIYAAGALYGELIVY